MAVCLAAPCGEVVAEELAEEASALNSVGNPREDRDVCSLLFAAHRTISIRYWGHSSPPPNRAPDKLAHALDPPGDLAAPAPPPWEITERAELRGKSEEREERKRCTNICAMPAYQQPARARH